MPFTAKVKMDSMATRCIVKVEDLAAYHAGRKAGAEVRN